jgi:hypothetical protein
VDAGEGHGPIFTLEEFLGVQISMSKAPPHSSANATTSLRPRRIPA